jgi:hypothetical protein
MNKECTLEIEGNVIGSIKIDLQEGLNLVG